MENNNKNTKIIIGVLVAVIAVLIGVVVVLLTTKDKPKKAGGEETKIEETTEGGNETTGNIKESKPEESTPETEESTPAPIKKEEIVDKPVSTGEATALVKGGFQFMVPKDYGVWFNDDIGIIFYMQDIFQMKIAIIEEDDAKYEGFVKDPESMTVKAKNAGAIITKECQEYEVDGVKLMCFLMDMEGDKCAVFRSRLDSGHSFAGELVMQSSDLTEKDAMKVFVGLLKSAEKTDKADTTAEDYYAAATKVEVGIKKESSTIKGGDIEITYKVAKNFFADGDDTYQDEDLHYYTQEYLTEAFDMLTISLKAYVGGAESYFKDDYYYEGCEIKQMDVEGHKVYYVSVRKEDDRGVVYRTSMASDVKEENGLQWIYTAELFSADPKEVLTVEDIKDFMIYTVK